MMSGITSFPQITLGTGNVTNPIDFNEPSWFFSPHRYKASVLDTEAAIIADTITFSKSWSAMLSASYSWLRAKNFNTAGVDTSRYDDSGVSPAVSLMYKPLENMTAYVTYADSLQQGDTAPVSAANANQTLAPYRSEQWEAGLKVALGKMNLSGALFRIERPLPYTDANNVFKVNGDQVNYGLELMAIGEVVDRVTVYGGVTLLDPKLKRTGNPVTADQQVVGVPEVQGNVLVEYRTPFIEGLTPFLNLHYTGRRPANDANTSWASSYMTIDLGARYVTHIKGVETIWRLAVMNLTNERYWSSVFPGSINGTGASSTAFLGSPQEIIGSVQVVF
jgi:iron complex outermembrane receptor protein